MTEPGNTDGAAGAAPAEPTGQQHAPMQNQQPSPYGQQPAPQPYGQQRPAPQPYGQPPAPQPYGQPGEYGPHEQTPPSGTPQQTQPYPAAGAWPGQASPGQREQASAPKTRLRGLLIGLIGGGALLVLLIVGGIVWFSVESAAHAPQAAVRPYLDALVKGDTAAATKAGHISSDSPTLTRSWYAAAKDHITSYKIVGTHTVSQASQVAVRYEQGGSRFTGAFTLRSVGTDMLFFTTWKLEPVVLPTVKVTLDAPSSASALVNGKALSVGSTGSVTLDVFPGTYAVSMKSTDLYQAKGDTVKVTDLMASPTTSTKAIDLDSELTAAGQKAADTAVNAWVAACIAQQAIQPVGCSFGLIDDYPNVHLSNQKWTLVTAPTFQIGPWDGAGWTVTTTAKGSATYLADASTDDGQVGTLYSQAPIGVAVAGEITGFGSDGSATFTSIDWSGKAALPTA